MPTTKPPAPWVELRVMRRKDGSTIRDLARRIGMTESGLGMLENGHRRPRPAVIRALALALNVPMSMIEPRERPADEVPAQREHPADDGADVQHRAIVPGGAGTPPFCTCGYVGGNGIARPLLATHLEEAAREELEGAPVDGAEQVPA